MPAHVIYDCRSGVARQLHTFLASPRKVCQRRRPRHSRPFGVPVCAVQKKGRPETRFPCRAHNRLQAIAVTQAKCMHFETPATPQTAVLLFPFSVLHKRRLHMGTAEIQKQPQRQYDLLRIFCVYFLVGPIYKNRDIPHLHPGLRFPLYCLY